MGTRILITNPSLVETGLDLNVFTTIVYYNIAYNLLTLRQSSRRSWRINQTAPRIEVYFFFYKDTMQARALRLMASKLAAAGVLEEKAAKAAILQTEVLSAPVLKLAEPVLPQGPIPPSMIQPEPVILFASAFQRRQKNAEPQFCEDQLSFFDQPA